MYGQINETTNCLSLQQMTVEHGADKTGESWSLMPEKTLS